MAARLQGMSEKRKPGYIKATAGVRERRMKVRSGPETVRKEWNGRGADQRRYPDAIESR
jgi:hypothetical protein